MKIFGKLIYKFLLNRDMSPVYKKYTGFKYNIWFDEISYQIHPFRNIIRIYIEYDNGCWYPLFITRNKLYYFGKNKNNISDIMKALSNRYIIFKIYWSDWLDDILDGESLKNAIKLMNTDLNISNADIVRKVSINAKG